jgi:anti-sigma B factor antagonist
VLHCRGEIDVASAPELHALLADLVGQGPETLVIDMSAVSFIDSSGLGVLVSAEKDMRMTGHGLRLVAPQPQIERLLEMTGLNEVFTVVSSMSDAVTA